MGQVDRSPRRRHSTSSSYSRMVLSVWRIIALIVVLEWTSNMQQRCRNDHHGLRSLQAMAWAPPDPSYFPENANDGNADPSSSSSSSGSSPSMESNVFVPVHEYRQKKEINFAYTTRTIHPELCRHMDEAECQHLDEHFTMLSSRMREHVASRNEERRRRQRQLNHDPVTNTTRQLTRLDDANGKLRIVVALIEFADHGARTKLDPSVYDSLFNGEGRDADTLKTGSVREYLDKQSYGALDFEAFVLPWVKIDRTEAQCSQSGVGSCVYGLSQDFIPCFTPALELADSLHTDPTSSFNWNDFDSNSDNVIDAVLVVHTGYAADRTLNCFEIWSHASSDSAGRWISGAPNVAMRLGTYAIGSGYRSTSGFKVTRFNVIVHEYIHTFGMPDLYDLTYQTAGTGGWSLMGNPYGPCRINAANPGSVSPYIKMELGWISPTFIVKDGRYSIGAVQNGPNIYILGNGIGFPKFEYLLIENRQPLDWDVNVCGGAGPGGSGGVLIWHIDLTQADNRGSGYPGSGDYPNSRYRIALVQADGLYELEKDVDNRGNEGDLFVRGREAGPSTIFGNNIPSTDSYITGSLVSTGIRIFDFTDSQETMEFTVEGLEDEEPSASPTSLPTSLPTDVPETEAPTALPTLSPTDPVVTDAPTLAPTVPIVTDSPTMMPTDPIVTDLPTLTPTTPIVTDSPTMMPTDPAVPTPGPTGFIVFRTEEPSTKATDDTSSPTLVPTDAIDSTSSPSMLPTNGDTSDPTPGPTGFIVFRTEEPSTKTTDDTSSPTFVPTGDANPTSSPSVLPTNGDTSTPTITPETTESPSDASDTGLPTSLPTQLPETTAAPSNLSDASSPSGSPTNTSTSAPTPAPTVSPTDPQATSAPTATPSLAIVTDSPTMLSDTSFPTSTANDQCFFVTNVDECEQLLATVTPQDGCDCYQFCDGQQAQCTSFGQAIQLACPSGNLVAGCTVDGMTKTPTQTPSKAPTERPTQTPTLPQCLVQVAFDDCDSVIGNAVPTEGCDCYQFCNGVQLPCCPAGEPCPISCEGELVAGCKLPEGDNTSVPTPTPLDMCMLTVNTGSCDALIETQTPAEECDCYNYCGGTYLGCCKFGEFCGITCAAGLVAGCVVDDRPPMEMCAVQSNPQACDALLDTVQPQSECDCYDFCDGVFVGCCEYGEFCGVVCGINEEYVGGCQFESPTSNPTPNPTSVPTMAPTQKQQPTSTPFFFFPPGFQ